MSRKTFQSRLLFPTFRYLSLPSIPPIFQSPSLSNIRFFFFLFLFFSIVLFFTSLFSTSFKYLPKWMQRTGPSARPRSFRFFFFSIFVGWSKQKKIWEWNYVYLNIVAFILFIEKKKRNIQFHLFLFFFSFVSQKLFVCFVFFFHREEIRIKV